MISLMIVKLNLIMSGNTCLSLLASDSMLVISSLTDIPDPFRRLISTFLLDAQVTNSQTRTCKRWHLEVKRDRGLIPNFSLSGRNELDICSEQTLGIPLKSFESPHDARIVRLINSSSCSAWKDANLCGVCGNWNFAYHVCSEIALLKYSF